MSISDHEKNYTPSCWSKRFESAELLEHFDKVSIEITADARRTIKCDLKIPYDIASETYYDVYGIDLPEDAPIFVFIHGGYWQKGNPDEAAFPASVFVANGIQVVIVGYTLCPDVKLGDIVSQIKKAIEQILTSVSKNRDVWIGGHCAGAHLVLSLLYDESWVDKMAEQGCMNLIKGVTLISGIFDLKPLLNTTINDALQLTKDEVAAYSFNTIGIKNLNCIQGLKMIVAVGDCESPVFINASQEFAQKLITVADSVQYLLVRDNTDHFGILERLADPEFSLTKTLVKQIN